MSKFTTLIDAATLASHLHRDDWVLFDCRSDLGNPSWGENEFALSHIPGAQFLHLERDMSGPMTPSSGRHPLPDASGFAAKLSAFGVDGTTQVVAYDQGPGAYAARAWWLLRWLGHRNVAVLDGGIAAWRQCGLPLEKELRPRAARHLEARVDDSAQVPAQTVNSLRHAPRSLIVDARGADRFQGRNETIDPIAGHVPGARSYPFALNLTADGKFHAREELGRRWRTMLGSLSASAVVSMCGSGVTACHNLLALEHAGLTGARLYPGSWSEWIRDPTRPIAMGSF